MWIAFGPVFSCACRYNARDGVTDFNSESYVVGWAACQLRIASFHSGWIASAERVHSTTLLKWVYDP